MTTDQSLPNLSSGTGSTSGCSFAVGLFFMGLCSLGSALAFLVILSPLEQDMMSKVHPEADFRWLYTLIMGVVVGLPGLLAWGIGRKSRLGGAGRAFFLAGVLVAVQAGARTVKVQEAQLGLLLQLTGILFFQILLIGRQRMIRSGLPVPNLAGMSWALAAGVGLGVPWVVLSTLGSPLDTLLALLVSSAAGVALTVVLLPILRGNQDGPYRYVHFLVDGLIAALVILPVAVALGTNGSAAMLAISLPWLGWTAAGLYRTWNGGKQSNWPVVAGLLGLGIFWALAFVDLEELSISLLGLNEAAQWVWLAAVAASAITIGILFTSLLLVRVWLNHRFAVRAGWILAGLVGIGLVGAYLGLGRPGFYGERLFVILKDQADLGQVAQTTDPLQRRKEVYQQLVDHAVSSQAGLRGALDQLGVGYTPYYLVNALEVQAEPLLSFWLMTRPEVDRVLIDTRLRPLPARFFIRFPASESNRDILSDETGWNLKMIGADRVWNELGVTGQGILVGQSDTGVQRDHPELSAGYLRRTASDDYSWFDPWYDSASPRDYGSHGTHTLGTVLGMRVGVAPGAQWIGCVNLARNLANPALYLDCMQFHLAPFPQHGDPFKDGRPEWGAQVLNNSWGCPPLEGCDPQALLYAVRALRAAGVFVVASAGNDGEEGCSTVSDPLAVYGEVTSVGAVDIHNNLAPFSSRGPVVSDGSGRFKPDLLAPGVGVLSAVPQNGYGKMSGTSMAGPHVAGVVALMWSANPRLVGDIQRTEEILYRTADEPQGSLPGVCGQVNTEGYGLVNAYEAVRAAQALK